MLNTQLCEFIDRFFTFQQHPCITTRHWTFSRVTLALPYPRFAAPFALVYFAFKILDFRALSLRRAARATPGIIKIWDFLSPFRFYVFWEQITGLDFPDLQFILRAGPGPFCTIAQQAGRKVELALWSWHRAQVSFGLTAWAVRLSGCSI